MQFLFFLFKYCNLFLLIEYIRSNSSDFIEKHKDKNILQPPPEWTSVPYIKASGAVSCPRVVTWLLEWSFPLCATAGKEKPGISLHSLPKIDDWGFWWPSLEMSSSPKTYCGAYRCEWGHINNRSIWHFTIFCTLRSPGLFSTRQGQFAHNIFAAGLRTFMLRTVKQLLESPQKSSFVKVPTHF